MSGKIGNFLGVLSQVWSECSKRIWEYKKREWEKITYPETQVWHREAWQRGWREDRPRPATTGSSWSHCGVFCLIPPRGKPIYFLIHRRLWTPPRIRNSSRCDAPSTYYRFWIDACRTRLNLRRRCRPASTPKSKAPDIHRSIFTLKINTLDFQRCRNEKRQFPDRSFSKETWEDTSPSDEDF